MVKVLCLSFILVSTSLYGQSVDELPAIEIDYSDDLGVYYAHTIKKGNTLYSLAKLFQVSVDEIRDINQWSEDQGLQLGASLKIPFDDQLLYKGASIDEFTNAHFIPVYYTIKPKETLYRVSKVYFGQDIELILQRNDLLGTHLDISQKLLMGWIPVENRSVISFNEEKIPIKENQVEVPPSNNSKEDGTIDDKDTKVSSIIEINTMEAPLIIDEDQLASTEDDSINLKIELEEIQIQQVETGLAYWNKKGSDNLNLFVLHPTAKINSLIEIYNPQLQRKTFAKVLGRIPDNMYADNIDLIVSPAVANVLGVFNSEFRVTMKYYN